MERGGEVGRGCGCECGGCCVKISDILKAAHTACFELLSPKTSGILRNGRPRRCCEGGMQQRRGRGGYTQLESKVDAEEEAGAEAGAGAGSATSLAFFLYLFYHYYYLCP